MKRIINIYNPARPESGRILIDGIDISQVNTQALRNRVVSLRFHKSIRITSSHQPMHHF